MATAFPAGAILPTAVPCGEPPTVQAQAGVNVRLGAGTDYGVQSGLLAGEVRPIVGRAGNAQWWLIELPGGKQGWVANQWVTVQGYTGNLPLVPPPPLGNATPTPGPIWRPTANPACLPTPVPTATSVATATTGAPAAPLPASAIQSVSSDEVEPAVTATPAGPSPQTEPTQTAAATPTVTETTAVRASAAPTAVPLNTSGSSAGTGWIVYAGLGLLLLSGVSFLAFGRRS
jgi:hypothetical protein